ncbi:hypothetical protein NPS70_16410 [Streptomyces sp. C10-9-1]|uniref:hypothetical protein n=1 Tax=Streptomyces sp. C10-9-1 TaxID=1859285 RepID=UPI002111E339|nr:hypothetical protein [Streptomyces sp. C10-9-1]MCQ6554769.1 hypothetical protein [Streptomyces sp. C10-9-1]
MVDRDALDPACSQHPPERCKTIRSSHAEEDCPSVGRDLVVAVGRTDAARQEVINVACMEPEGFVNAGIFDALDDFRAAVEHEAAERIRYWERGARTLLPLERGAARGAANLIDPEVTYE